jgi:hypothetical protein
LTSAEIAALPQPVETVGREKCRHNWIVYSIDQLHILTSAHP